MSSLVYLLVWSTPPDIPYVSSPNQCLLSATHAIHRNLFCCSTNIISPIPSLSLNSLLGTLSSTVTIHIHLTILISARWSSLREKKTSLSVQLQKLYCHVLIILSSVHLEHWLSDGNRNGTHPLKTINLKRFFLWYQAKPGVTPVSYTSTESSSSNVLITE